jgi:transposase InsO family protein
MSWKECDRVSQRLEFVQFCEDGSLPMAELCRRFGISPKTGYKWLRRYRAGGVSCLADQSRRPKSTPTRTAREMEERIVDVRVRHPAWGGRKIGRWLLNEAQADVPASSTITEVLRRHGLIEEGNSRKAKSWTRFEHAAPNELWQMDFKGHFGLQGGGRCHPLGVLDDHSRFSLGLRACGNEQEMTVRQELERVFQQYGVPRAMLMDNGSPWGHDLEHGHTRLTVWLMKQGIAVRHGGPYHPQTQGKEERFHRTLKAEVLQGREFRDLGDCQLRFDDWRSIYNQERPHEALGLEVPAKRYHPSGRAYQRQPAEWDYGPGAQVRKVCDPGKVWFHGQAYRVSKAFIGERVGLRPLQADGQWAVYFRHCCIQLLDLSTKKRC